MAPVALQPASIVDERFVLESEAKRGGMGTVWRARDLLGGRAVALKVLHDTSAEQCRRFVRERQFLADLVHPNIVGYVAHGVIADDAPYLVMEWLDGESLAERLARSPLTLQETMSLLRVALNGLGFAHRRGVVHRDIKPSNLFLRERRVDQVVLLDLGLARYAGGDSALTRSGSILGTPGYMAPEQAQGEPDVGSAADVFSLGCVLFECLTGAAPFVGAQLVTVLAKVLFQPAPRLAELRPELPESLDQLLERMLDKDPARRAQHADALIAELEALGPLPSVQAPSAPQRASDAEQELIGVILANEAEGPSEWARAELATLPALQPLAAPWAEVATYGGDLRRLADGTTVVIVTQHGGAATDLTARAARCALYMRRVRPELCYALATGRGIASQHSYVGDAVERAAIMLRAMVGGASGSIWVDETTSGLLDARFRRSRAEQGIVVFALEGEDQSVDPARRLLGRPTPCVGREQELGVLALSLRSCIDEGSPQATLLVGPPGIGKSRLRHEFLRRSQAEYELTLLLGLGDPIRSAASCGLLGQALGRLCGLHSDASDAVNHEALAARVGANLPGDRELSTVFLAELCGLPELPPLRPELRAARQNPTVMIERLMQAWLAFVRAEAASKPLVIVLDDLQWSDPLTITLIGATLREPDLRVVVLALGRPETLELFPELWAPRLATLPVRPLTATATRRLIRDVLGEQVGDERVERIVAHAGGNALYLEELIRAAEAGREATPETVLAMLQARIGLLPPAARRVLRAASVFGEQFPLAGVAALLSDAAAPSELQSLLALLDKQELLEPRSSGERLRFRHALLRDAAYALITAEDRRLAHELAARHLESTDEDHVVIGAHCQLGGDAARAIHHYAIAARQSFQRNEALTTLDLVERCASLGATGPELGRLRNFECVARFYQHDFAGAWEAGRAALELLPVGHPQRTQAVASTTYVALQIGRVAEVVPLIDELLVSEPAEDEHADWARAIGYASITYITQAERARAQLLIARLVEFDRLVGDDDLVVRGTLLYWQLRYQVLLGDDPVAALAIARRGAPYLEQAGDWRIACAIWAEIGECTRRAHSLQRSVTHLRTAVAHARSFDERVSTAFVIPYLANALSALATPESLDEAHALCREALSLTAEGSAYRALVHGACALAHLHSQDFSTAEQHARTGHREMHALGMRAYVPHLDNALIRTLLANGHATEAAAVADDAIRNADAYGPLGLLEPAMRVAAARARLAVGRRPEAHSDVQRALAQLAFRLSKIDDEADRRRAQIEVPENAELIALARELES